MCRSFPAAFLLFPPSILASSPSCSSTLIPFFHLLMRTRPLALQPPNTPHCSYCIFICSVLLTKTHSSVSSHTPQVSKGKGRREVCGIYGRQTDRNRDLSAPQVALQLCPLCFQPASRSGMFGDPSQAFL